MARNLKQEVILMGEIVARTIRLKGLEAEVKTFSEGKAFGLHVVKERPTWHGVESLIVHNNKLTLRRTVAVKGRGGRPIRRKLVAFTGRLSAAAFDKATVKLEAYVIDGKPKAKNWELIRHGRGSGR